MISRNIFFALLKSFKIKEYPTADKNANPFRIMAQGLPYFFSKSGYAFSPLSVFIHVNTRCNLKCIMCDVGLDNTDSMFYQNLKGSGSGDMPIQSYKMIIDKVKHFKPFIGIPVLEPLLYPHITEAISYTRHNNLRMSIATNGYLLEKKAEDIIKQNLSKLIISLDGPRSIHDKIRGVPGTFEKVIDGILKVDELKRKYGKNEPYISLNYVISEDNYNTIIEFMEEIPLNAITFIDFRVMFFLTEELAKKHNESFGVKYNATSTCLSGGIDLKNIDTDILYDQIIKVTNKFPHKCKFFFNHGRNELHTYYHNPDVFLDSTGCVFPWYTMQIDSDGGVIPPQRCYHNVFGNILKQNFDEIWNGEKMRDFRRDLKKYKRFPACTRCEGVNF